MLLIDDTYFVNEISIPINQIESLNNAISFYETVFLRKVFGVEMFNEFKAAIESGTPAQKWLDLKDGADYLGLDGKTYHFDGLLNETLKRSIIADYVYCQFVFNNIISLGTNLETPLSENSEKVTSNNYIFDKYNNVVKKIGLIPFKNYDYDVLTDTFSSDNENVREDIPQQSVNGTLFDFLYWSNYNNDTYLNLLFTELSYQTRI